MSFNLKSLLTGAGVTGSALTSILSQAAASSPVHAVQAALQVVTANAGNGDVIKDECTKIAEIANVPAGVTALLPKLQATAAASPVDPQQVLTIVGLMNTALNGSGSLSLSNIL